MIAEAILTMKPGSTLMGTLQGLCRADVHGDFSFTKFRRIKRVAGCLFDFDVAGYRGDRHHADVGSAQRHDEGHSVIGSNVGVDEEGARHGGKIANAGLND